MSVSIYYTAKRKEPLTDAEKSIVEQITEKYSVADKVEQYLQTGVGFSGEGFSWDKTPWEPEAVLQGSTKLPLTMDECEWAVLRWCAVLSEVRRAISSLEWWVTMDDYEIHWDEVAQQFDPTIEKS